ncbi:XTP/dITP diphosphatase [Sedimentibacter sp. MB31-C6]|uniref:XTP/dITP diphosphatase n=1 Tax=Sedimentibacter sp. MB31-C6 TaxID=3109366 RepID=UPI002DDCB1A4|nr:XTP/dITP diphosphatase [Sedimentibacter sp. MB36-C1]WSI02872.1 XTP/dITP diphosphatase [Sedimentibacter sp. MB36-C1]
MKRKIVLSSGNKHKINEIKDILKNMPFEVVSKDDLGYENFDVVEDGKTLEENAFKKAQELRKLVNEIVIADDTGLFVDALNGEPGVYSARYAGENVSYSDNNKLLLKNLQNVAMENRTAYFKTVIAVILENGEKIIAEGKCSGKIAFESKGENGFGYDPLFIVDEINKTFAELSESDKNKISHRAKALLSLKKKLEDI